VSVLNPIARKIYHISYIYHKPQFPHFHYHKSAIISSKSHLLLTKASFLLLKSMFWLVKWSDFHWFSPVLTLSGAAPASSATSVSSLRPGVWDSLGSMDVHPPRNGVLEHLGSVPETSPLLAVSKLFSLSHSVYLFSMGTMKHCARFPKIVFKRLLKHTERNLGLLARIQHKHNHTHTSHKGVPVVFGG
jgi:hypothetical protein